MLNFELQVADMYANEHFCSYYLLICNGSKKKSGYPSLLLCCWHQVDHILKINKQTTKKSYYRKIFDTFYIRDIRQFVQQKG